MELYEITEESSWVWSWKSLLFKNKIRGLFRVSLGILTGQGPCKKYVEWEGDLYTVLFKNSLKQLGPIMDEKLKISKFRQISSKFQFLPVSSKYQTHSLRGSTLKRSKKTRRVFVSFPEKVKLSEIYRTHQRITEDYFTLTHTKTQFSKWR